MKKFWEIPLYWFFIAFILSFFILDCLLYFPIKSNAQDFEEIQKTDFTGFLVSNYFFNLALYLLKIIWFFLIIQAVNLSLDYKIDWKGIFKILILCQFIYLLPLLIKDVWFLLIHTNYTTNDIIDFKSINFSILSNLYNGKDSFAFIIEKITFLDIAFLLAYLLSFASLLRGMEEKKIVLFCSVSYGIYAVFNVILYLYTVVFFM